MTRIAKKAVALLVCICMFSSLTGCWNYRGLNNVNIVAGVAIDKDDDGLFLITLEIISINSENNESVIKPTTIKVKGSTIFEAIRNSKKRTVNQAYFAHNQVIIVSHQIAEEDGLSRVLDVFMRVPEFRETSCVIISAEDTASELLEAEHIDSPIISFEMMEIIKKDNKLTASTRYVQKYMIFQEILNQGEELTLPVFDLVDNDNKQVNETTGVAAFKKDKLVGYLGSEETKYFLMVINEMKGGVFSLINDEIYSFEIIQSNIKISYELIDGKLKFIIKPVVEVRMVENSDEDKKITRKQISATEDALQLMITEEIFGVIQKAQNEFESDIFGFGEVVYQRDLKLWNTVKEDWNENFKNVEIEIKPKVTVIDTNILL